ncbi:MAG: DNA-deoxyinosine glycosylase [Clostridia bacterium]
MIYSYQPIWRDDAQSLILGTMPSVKSLEAGFYYAHPRNAFWPIMAEVLGAPRPEGAQEKAALLRENRIALWDVLESCVREGSLDANILSPSPNDIPFLLARCPAINRIFFCGTAARQLYRRYFGHILVKTVLLPSTSPANTMPYQQKLAAWRAAFEEAIP